MNTRASLLAGAGLFELSPLHVDEGDRIGFLHEDKAAALGRLMAVDGQRDPIKVARNPGNDELPWKLVTGMHRLIGARIEGITVFAIEVSGDPEDLVDLEASENLHRRPLGPIERAKFTAALVQAAQERLAREHGDLTAQQRGAKKRWDEVRSGAVLAERALRDDGDDACATLAQAYSWEESVGEALGMSRRSIHRDLALHRLIIEPFPELAEPLSRHSVVGENAAQLKLIAGIRLHEQRRAAIKLLLTDDGRELSAQGAMEALGIPAPPSNGNRMDPAAEGQTKYLNSAERNIERLSHATWKSWAPRFASVLKPATLLTVRDAVLAEIENRGIVDGQGGDDGEE